MDTDTVKIVLTSQDSRAQTLSDHVQVALRNYFSNLHGERVCGVYDMVLSEIEVPLLEVVLEYARGNQTLAAEILGLNRGTLRKKLKTYHMM